MKTLHVIKIGGNVLDNPERLARFLDDFSAIGESKILVHGGGKLATSLSATLGIETKMIEGRRITDAETLKIVTMVYAGLLNKQVVAGLQARNCNAMGFTGADGNVIPAEKRPVKTIDYGFAGDIVQEKINTKALKVMLESNIVPVFCGITHDGKGQLLNTNADTIASALAVAMTEDYKVVLHYCFEKQGVLRDVDDDRSVIAKISQEEYKYYKIKSIIADGMVPKLDNAFNAINSGVDHVTIGYSGKIRDMVADVEDAGTVLVK
ncbi:MAG: acetylglutamate kinase [Bacteroidota bacterium]